MSSPLACVTELAGDSAALTLDVFERNSFDITAYEKVYHQSKWYIVEKDYWDADLQCSYARFWSQTEWLKSFDATSITYDASTTTKKPKAACSVGREFLKYVARNGLSRSACVFAPQWNATLGDNVFNLWRGWNARPDPLGAGTEACSLVYTLLNDLMGNPDIVRFFLDFVASIFQRSTEPGGYIIYLCSDVRGIGKSFVLELLLDLVGRSAIALPDMSLLCGEFSAHLRNRCLAIVDEGAENKSTVDWHDE